MVEWYNQNPQYMEGVQNLAMEEQVVDLIMKDAVIRDEAMSFEALMQKSNANRAEQ